MLAVADQVWKMTWAIIVERREAVVGDVVARKKFHVRAMGTDAIDVAWQTLACHEVHPKAECDVDFVGPRFPWWARALYPSAMEELIMSSFGLNRVTSLGPFNDKRMKLSAAGPSICCDIAIIQHPGRAPIGNTSVNR